MTEAKYCQRYKQSGKKSLLYGSRARGDNRTDSDWDLLVLLNRPQKEDNDFAAISYPLMELGFSLGQYFFLTKNRRRYIKNT
ncbi:MAG: nucleotidyltransferase domain-containing protein [Paludibacteraceae bacterium]|nr:nucleotidyltransferase domain-containing protein [Paludibacteraceae bacterium]